MFPLVTAPHSGFVLAGGASRRMGSDKALLPWRGRTLLESVAHTVAEAAGNVTILAPTGRYEHLGFPVLADMRPGDGPLAGIEAALLSTNTNWNLFVACDLPEVTVPFLRRLLESAQGHGAVGVDTGGQAQPLCAVYHRRILPALQAALDLGHRKVHNLLKDLDIIWVEADGPHTLRNLNTPSDLTGHG